MAALSFPPRSIWDPIEEARVDSLKVRVLVSCVLLISA